MIIVHGNKAEVRIKADFLRKDREMCIILKHNTDKIVYIFTVNAKKERIHINFSFDFPEIAPFGEYTYYLTFDKVEDVELDVLDTEVLRPVLITNKGKLITNKGIALSTGNYCKDKIRILSEGLLQRVKDKIEFPSYERKRIFEEYDKTRE